VKGCLFCSIANGEGSADVLHEDDLVVAFRDINPQAPTHILIVPKEHIESAKAIKDRHGDLMTTIFQVAAHLAKSEGVERGGWRVVTNVGPDAGQSVHHLHFHLIGGRSMAWPPG
jgi:histidine triad (HIT) family protein